MLNRSAILDTLLQGCVAGDFVLRVTRADKSTRTFWKNLPDDAAKQDPSLEVALSDAVILAELGGALLAPGALPGLWKDDVLTLAAIAEYFSGKHIVEVDKGGYTENVLIPAVDSAAIATAIADAVKTGRVWLVNGTISVLGEEVPGGFVNESAQLFPPPSSISTADVLPGELTAAWTNGETNAQLIHAALSAKAGKPLPWTRVKQALDDAFRLGLIERPLGSAPWPCDMGGAAAVKIRFREGKAEEKGGSQDAKVASAELQVNEVQDFADHIDELREATAGQSLRICISVEIGEDGKVDQAVIDEVNRVLAKIKDGWMAK